jgi:NAD(P)-dependent dehydrogenase (short-subunit alcohol dehydrogenase family)
MKFNNKICVVTGGANGIGRCITEAFIEEGARVAVIDTDAVSGAKLAQKHGDKLLFVQGDISEKQSLEHFAKTVLAAYGNVDFLINNACINKKGVLSGCSYDDFNDVLRIGVTAPYYLTLLFADHFALGAAIINISSTRCMMSQPDTESYTAAKGGISALTHALSVSLAGRVRVNAVSPGWIDTGAYQHEDSYMPNYSASDEAQHPAGRVGNPRDIASMVLYLCSEQAGFIDGQNIVVDGGMTRQMIYHDDHGWTLNKKE